MAVALDVNPPVRIAMWSGPRNISTAMMRAWENRPDTIVIDEPFYAHYLLRTRAPHPGADEVIAHHPTDPDMIVRTLCAPLPPGKSIFYQKHMAHHLLPDIDRDWIAQVTNCFLIREPAAMLASLIKVTPDPTLADTGLPQQRELFERVRARQTTAPLVIDSADVLAPPRGPEQMMCAMCTWLGVPFSERMMRWPAGPRPTDGVWAKHWYDSVWRSTGFNVAAPNDPPELPSRFSGLLRQCREIYLELHAHRLLPP